MASLVAVAQEHFAFFSAQETAEEGQPQVDGEPLEGVGEESGLVDLTQRMTHVVGMLDFLQDSMRVLVAQQLPASSKAAPARPARPMAQPVAEPGLAPAQKSKAVKKVLPTPRSMSASGPPRTAQPGLYPHLDPGVVQAAVQAGISHESLKQMEMVVSQNVKARKIQDLHHGLALDPLSEHDDAGELDAKVADESGSPEHPRDFGSALDRLASIMEMLTEDKKKKATSSKLDAALDNASLGGSDATSLGSGKKSAAARRALRNAFQDHPEEIYAMVEKLMFEDLNSQTLAPGQQPRGLSARAWIEFRSKINAYKACAHSAWALGGVLDSLIAGNVAQARARAALGLLQIDQACIDRGSWVLAGELNLEIGPPLTAMSQHTVPDVQQGDSPFSKLLDSRWAEVSLGHLRDQEEYLTRRRNIGEGQSQKADGTEEASPSVPRRRAKPAPKPKSGAGGEKGPDA